MRSVDSKADLERQTKHGYTALMHSCRNGHVLCVLALLRAGADPNKANAIGFFGSLMVWQEILQSVNYSG